MTDTQTKNFWTVTLDQYQPVLVTADGDILMEADFSLAEENVDSGTRLHRLVDFLHKSKLHVEHVAPDSRYIYQFGISHKVVEQIVYLAYWKNYRLELGIDAVGDDIAARAYFTNQPELNCVLDQYSNGFDVWDGLQSWLDFFYSIIAEHAEIWQIHLILDERLYQQLVIPDYGKVFVEVAKLPTSARLPELLHLAY